MSFSVGHGDRQSQQGCERRTNTGSPFTRPMTFHTRGGIATSEATYSSNASIHEESVNELVVDEEEEEEERNPGEAEAIPSHGEKIERSDRIVLHINTARSSYFYSAVPQIPPRSDTNTMSIPITYMRGVERHERTQRLLAKYGLSVEAQDWMPTDSTVPSTVLRVEKPIRVRVRYTCHLCEDLFGVERTCKKCSHKRCDECPRHPSKRSMMKDDANKENFNSGKDVVTSRKREHDVEQSEGNSQAASDGPTPVMQQLQHSCHKCKTAFEQRGRLCSSCGHLRCARCPRHLADWNYNGSGDEPLRPERVYRQPRQRVQWICDHCQSTFTEGSRVCGECLHKRCEACSRIPYASLFPIINDFIADMM
jgi:hypothetical protein